MELTTDSQSPASTERPAGTVAADRVPWAVAGAILALGTLIQVWRLGVSRALNTMWAEDGAKFYQESQQGLLPILGEPYAGYLHSVPRIWAWVASLFPVEWAPAVISVGASLTVAAVAAYAYVATSGYIRSSSLRLVLAAFILCVPLARYEAAGNLTNLHWYLLAGATFAALAGQRNPAVRIASVVLVVAATTSEGLAILLAPAFLALWWLDRGRGRGVVLIAFLAGSAVQLAVILTDRGMAPAPGDDGRLDVLLLPGVYLTRVLAPAFASEQVTQRSFVMGLDVGSVGLVLLGTLAIAAVTGYALLRKGVPDRSAGVLLLLYSGIFFGAPMLVHRDLERFAGVGGHEGVSYGARYFIAPSILLVAAILAMLSQRDQRVPSRAWQLLTRLGAAAIILSLIAGFPMQPLSQAQPSWSGQLDDAEHYCRDNPRPDSGVSIMIQPEGWSVALSCDVLNGRN